MVGVILAHLNDMSSLLYYLSCTQFIAGVLLEIGVLKSVLMML